MKKYFFVLLSTVLLSFAMQAQITHLGVRAAAGASWVGDDLLTSAPIIGGSLGGIMNIGLINSNTSYSDNLFFQTGLLLTRRGTKFSQEFRGMQSYREGFYHSYYLQVPVLVGWRWEMPLQVADQYLNFYFGPAANIGVFGNRGDRQVTPGYPMESINYDTYVTNKGDKPVFNQIRRFDLSLNMGVSYQHGDFEFGMWFEHGIIALMYEDDVLNVLERNNYQQNGTNTGDKPKSHNGYTGNNNAVMVGMTYLIPWR